MTPRRGELRRTFRLPLSRETAERDVAEEIRFHIETRVAELEASGLPPAAARERAHREFGDVDEAVAELGDLARSRARRRTRTTHMGDLRMDLARALRGVTRRPGLSASIVVTLALGIGVNAAMFGVTDRLLLRPPAGVQEPERVKRIYIESMASWGELVAGTSTTWLNLPLLQESVDGFEGVAGFFASRVSQGRGAGSRQARVLAVTHDFFELLGARPVLGREFAPEEGVPGDPRYVAVLSHDHWRRDFGADPTAIGAQVELGGRSYTIVGVAPQGFAGIQLGPVEVFLPIPAFAEARFGERWRTGRGMNWIQLVARIAPGASEEEAAAQATAAIAGVDEEDGFGEDPHDRVVLGSLIAARAPASAGGMGGDARVSLLLQGVSLMVLLIAAANVANLLLMRALRQKAEIGIRLALGISRGRLVRQIFLDTLLLAAAGGALGLALAATLGRFAERLLLPEREWASLLGDTRALLFTAILVLLCAGLAAAIPAFHSVRQNVAAVLGTGSRAGLGRTRAGRALIVAQATFSVVLLVGAGLFVRSFERARGADVGMDTERVLFLTWDDRASDRPRAAWPPLYEQAVERARGIPGVERASLGAMVPFYSNWTQDVEVPGRDTLPGLGGRTPFLAPVDAEYFATLGLELRRGRGIADDDVQGGPMVAVVGEAFATAVFPGEDPLGKCFRFTDANSAEPQPCIEVVGVVEDASWQDIQGEPPPQFYVPMAQHGEAPWRTVFIRTAADADASVIRRITSAVQGIEEGLPYVSVRFMSELTDPYVRPWRIGASLFTAFGGLALMLALIGLIGVLLYEVDRRRQEIGVRVALGASTRGVVSLILREVGGVLAWGVALGLGVALAAGGLVQPLLFEGTGRDPVVYGLVVVVLLGCGLLAGAVPARRAARLHPATVLRGE